MKNTLAIETLRWRAPDQPPAADANVLIDIGRLGVWPGWWTGQDWRIEGDRPEGAVTEIVAWAPMPVGLGGVAR